jgi:hypothetical protein
MIEEPRRWQHHDPALRFGCAPGRKGWWAARGTPDVSRQPEHAVAIGAAEVGGHHQLRHRCRILGRAYLLSMSI